MSHNHERENDLSNFLTIDETGKQIPNFEPFDLIGNTQEHRRTQQQTTIIKNQFDYLRKTFKRYIKKNLKDLEKLKKIKEDRPALNFKIRCQNYEKKLRHYLNKLMNYKEKPEEYIKTLNKYNFLLSKLISDFEEVRTLYRAFNNEIRDNKRIFPLLKPNLFICSNSEFIEETLNYLIFDYNYLNKYIFELIQNAAEHEEEEEEKLKERIKGRLMKLKAMTSGGILNQIEQFENDQFKQRLNKNKETFLNYVKANKEQFEDVEEIEKEEEKTIDETLKQRRENGEWKKERQILNDLLNKLHINFDELNILESENFNEYERILININQTLFKFIDVFK